VNGIYRLSIEGTAYGQMHVHTLHFRSTVDPDGLAMSENAYQQGLIDSWQSLARTLYRGIFNTAVSACQLYRVRKVCGSVPLPAGIDEAEVAGSILGTISPGSAEEAPWLCNNVTWRTGFSGKSYRGRSFFGGMLVADHAGGTVSGGRITNTAAYCTALITNYVTPADVDTPYRLFVYSRTLAVGKPDADPPVAPVACQLAGGDVTTFQTRTALASMKTRKAGSGS
jgi:hypothetical protein